MTRYNFALLSLLAGTTFAVPHYGQYGHRHPVHVKSGSSPSGVFPPGPSAGSTAPYGQGNSTTVAPTGSAPVSSVPVITSVVTVIPQPVSSGSGNSPVQSSGVGNSPVGGSSAGGEECGPATITITSANTVTVTVPAVESTAVESPIPGTSAPYGNGTTTAPIGTGTAGTGSPAPSSSLAVVVPPVSSSNGYESPSVAHPIPLASSTVENSPETPATTSPEVVATTTPKAAITTSAPAGGQFYQAETTSENAPSSIVINSPEQATSSISTPEASVAPSTGNVVARGLVYNEASLTSAFDNSNIGWMYNWDSSPGGTVDTGKEFIPMLWDTLTPYHTPHWESNAEAAIAAGSKHLLAFNEPDLGGQANMNIGQSVDGWNKYMEPFHTKYNGDIKLGSPSVCNGPDQNQGLAYLATFLEKCGGCHIDFLAIHWYGLATDDGVQNLKDHIGKATAMAGGRPIWLTEFQPSGSDEDQAKFLNQILPWLDDKSNGVERYAYFKVETMVSGGALNGVGQAYAG
ncbi:MAG: hypothetical protein L6R41_000318 [Letrouitia leprolyta]|nr:MAG: hypothetical protein L6R41_000318 [Letrouitia leprolyta]